jgi:uncharacterized Zn finger protein
MQVLYRINGGAEKPAPDKDSAIRAARKAALKLNDSRGVYHVEVLTRDDEDPEQYSILHRDIVLAEHLEQLKTEDLKPIGLVTSSKNDYVVEKKKLKPEEMYKVGDHVMISDELHEITVVTESRAMAQPIQKKMTTIVDKFTEKSRTFAIRRKPVTLAPVATNVLTKAQVEAELKKIKELEAQHAEQRAASIKSADGKQKADTTTSGDSGESSSSSEPSPRRKRGRPRKQR